MTVDAVRSYDRIGIQCEFLSISEEPEVEEELMIMKIKYFNEVHQ